jgi:CheY-like chemotaxis protein
MINIQYPISNIQYPLPVGNPSANEIFSSQKGNYWLEKGVFGANSPQAPALHFNHETSHSIIFMKTIFILDSNSSRQSQMNHHFTAMGFSPRSFSSAAEFESVNGKPFLIILDEKVVNGDKSGLQFLKKVHKKMSGVPIVYMATRVEKRLVSEAKKIGAYEVIEKNSAEFVNLRTTLDKLITDPPKTGWFSRLFVKKQTNFLPALSV